MITLAAMPDFHRPALRSPNLFEAHADTRPDPADTTAAGHRVAQLLVRGTRSDAEGELVERVLHLADTEGLSTIAELWSDAPADSLAGALWRLYVLRTWVHRQPHQAAHEFDVGKSFAPVQEVLAGVIDPPGPEEVAVLVDAVVRGIVGEHFDVSLDRAAAFAHIVGVGRGQSDDPISGAKLVETARDLHHAAELERAGLLS